MSIAARSTQYKTKAAAVSAAATWSASLHHALLELAPQRLAGLEVRHLPVVDSSNSELLRQAQAGRTHPQLLWADTQSAGRGRLGREWQSGSANAAQAAWRSLSFSIGLAYAPPDWSGLSLAVGCAVAETLGAEIALKWPNDICLPLPQGGGQYAKLGGILLETTPIDSSLLPVQALATGHSPRWLVAGVGLNVEGGPSGPDLRSPVADLAQVFGPQAPQLADLPALCHRLIFTICQALLQFEHSGFAPFAPRFQSRDILRGQPVQAQAARQGPTPQQAAIALGVAADGGYQIQHADGSVETIYSAEISLRSSLA